MGRQHRHTEKTKEIMTRQPLRYTIPVNDEPQQFPAGKILHLARHRTMPSNGILEVWVEVETPVTNLQTLQVIGTGQDIPDGAQHLATTLDGPFVWHLYRLGETS